MNEEWKDVLGFEGLYQVSNSGLVRSADCVSNNRWGSYLKKGRMVSIGKTQRYNVVCLYKDNTEYRLLLHRLIAIAFIPNPEGKPNINHKNGLSFDNRISNLEWCTQSENVRHAVENKLIKNQVRGESSGNSKLTEDDVLLIRFIGRSIYATEIAAMFGVCQTSILNILVRKTWAHI